jgi:hypothetical protein
MSLEAIRDLRLQGQKPSGVVTVLIGRRPRVVHSDRMLVVVRAKDDPRFIDWRPLVGLTVAVFSATTDPFRILAVLEALEAAGARFFGAADPSGTFPMVAGAGVEHHRALRGMWEALCQ